MERLGVVLAVEPGHQLVAAGHPDPTWHHGHIDSIEDFGVLTVASAHSPVITGDAIRRSFDLIRGLAGRPILPGPGQEQLDELLALTLVGAPPADA